MTASVCWTVVVLCALATFAARAAGPAAAGRTGLPPAGARIVSLLAPALLAALVVTQAGADGATLGVRADTAGVVVAALLVWLRTPLLIVVLAAAGTAALLRLAGVG